MITRTIIATVWAVIVIAVLGGLGFVYSGVYNVGATDRHWDLTYWLMQTARTRSIRAHAAGIPVPPGLDDRDKLVMGAEHFAAHCAVCHGAPGVSKGDVAAGLYPLPPNLAGVAEQFSPAELFWIVKNGIKMSGMPAWADHSDEELWVMVAFLRKLPGMTQEEYAKLVMASMPHAGHQYEGRQGDAPAATPAPEKHQH
jgi:mono/diheme cytochrome c family protein